MKIVIAPDSFKGSLTAREASQSIESGILGVLPEAECVSIPMADGGEGTVQSLVDATGGRIMRVLVTDPLGHPTNAEYGILGDGRTAVIEMAAASGIQYIDETTRNPLIATTYGTGELIKDALEQGVSDIIVGLGGSATNDGGAGMAQALGVRLLDDNGAPLPFGGAALAELSEVDVSGLDPRLADVRIRLASDVTNPLTGVRGASAVFGPQKGATPDMVERLDDELADYAAVIRKQLGREVETVPGAGAAGGLGAGFLAFTEASMRSGVDLVIEATGFRRGWPQGRTIASPAKEASTFRRNTAKRRWVWPARSSRRRRIARWWRWPAASGRVSISCMTWASTRFSASCQASPPCATPSTMRRTTWPVPPKTWPVCWPAI